MIDFTVTVLGNGSAVPTSWHNPSGQVVFYSGKQFLVDCGEGTQMQMIRYKVKRKNLDHIFISHLHGDHYYGLIGLLNTFHLMRREKPLTIFAPADLKKVIDLQLKVSKTTLFYPLNFYPLEDYSSEYLYNDGHLTVKAFPLLHSISVWGFLFKENIASNRIDKSFIKKYQPSVDDIIKIINGEDYTTPGGKVLKQEVITLPPAPPRSFAYCSDTAYQKSTVEAVKGVDLLYHESTFDKSANELALRTLHSTATDAALVAKQAAVKKLLLGHYSARFNDLDELLTEARGVFSATDLSKEGETYRID